MCLGRGQRCIGGLPEKDGLAEALIAVLGDTMLRDQYVEAAGAAVRQYDWSVVADEIMRVYETVAVAGVKVTVAGARTATAPEATPIPAES